MQISIFYLQEISSSAQLLNCYFHSPLLSACIWIIMKYKCLALRYRIKLQCASQKSGSNYKFKAKLSDFSKLQQLRITYKDLEASTYSVFFLLLASINPSHSITWCRRFFPKLNRSEYHLTLSSDKMSRLGLSLYYINMQLLYFLLHFLHKKESLFKFF